jgi:hypothetical protein
MNVLSFPQPVNADKKPRLTQRFRLNNGQMTIIRKNEKNNEFEIFLERDPNNVLVSEKKYIVKNWANDTWGQKTENA